MANDFLNDLLAQYDTSPEELNELTSSLATPSIDEDVQNASERARATVERRTTKSVPVYAYNDAGELVADGMTGDGDALMKNRLQYNNTTDGTRTYNAWETYHKPWKDSKTGIMKFSSEDKAFVKRMTKQRKALAKVSGMAYEDVTNEHVYNMGEATAGKLQELLRAGSGDDPTNPLRISGYGENLDKDGNVMKAIGSSRSLVHAKASDGTNILNYLNTPEFNASFYEKWNVDGQADYHQGQTDKARNKSLSDSDVNTTTGDLIGAKTQTAFDAVSDGIDYVTAKTADIAADAVGKVTTDLVSAYSKDSKGHEKISMLAFSKLSDGEKDDYIEAHPTNGKAHHKELDMFDSIVTVKKRSERDGLLNEALAKLYPDRIPGMNASDIFDANLSAKQRAYIDTGVFNLDSEREVKGKGYQALIKGKEYGDAIRESHNKSANAAPVEDLTQRAVTLQKKTTSATTIYTDASSKDLKARYTEGEALIAKGETVAGYAKLAEGFVTNLVDHPMAATQGALNSAPEMALTMVSMGVSVALTSNTSYADQVEGFKKTHGGRNPTQEEDNLIMKLALGKGILDAGGDKLLVNGIPTKALNSFTDALYKVTKGLSKSKIVAWVAGMATAGGSEAVQEGFTEALEQIGMNQGTDKVFDLGKLYEASVQGSSGGVATKGVLTSVNIPGSISGDINALGNKITNPIKQRIKDTVPTGYKYATHATKSSNTSLSDGIGDVEGGKAGYEAYNAGVAGDSTDDIGLSSMTLGELQRRQGLKKGDADKILAAGKYQMIGSTLREGMKHLGLKETDVYTPAIQERLFTEYLITKKRPAIGNYITGVNASLDKARIELGHEWAAGAINANDDAAYGGSAGNPDTATLGWVKSGVFLKNSRAIYTNLIKEGVSPKEALRRAVHSDVKGNLTGGYANKSIMHTATGETANTIDDIAKGAKEAYKPTETVEQPIVEPIINTSPQPTPDEVTLTPNNASLGDTDAVVETITIDAYKAKVQELSLNASTAMEYLEGLDDDVSDDDYDAADMAVEVADNALEKYMNDVANTATTAPTQENTVINAVVRGSAGIGKVDTSGLTTRYKRLVDGLASFSDEILRTTDKNVSKTLDNVRAEVLSTEHIGKTFVGLGKHMSNIAIAVSSNDADMGDAAINKLVTFQDKQLHKITALKQQLVDKKDIVKLNGSFTFKYIRDNSTKKQLRDIEASQKLINKGVTLANEMFNAQHNIENTITETSVFDEILEGYSGSTTNTVVTDTTGTFLNYSDNDMSDSGSIDYDTEEYSNYLSTQNTIGVTSSTEANPVSTETRTNDSNAITVLKARQASIISKRIDIQAQDAGIDDVLHPKLVALKNSVSQGKEVLASKVSSTIKQVAGEIAASKLAEKAKAVIAQGSGKLVIQGKTTASNKDAVKFKGANKLIAYGTPSSSTGRYANDNKAVVNTGEYKASDTVAVSLNGSSREGSKENYKLAIVEVDKAIKAGSTVITDKAGTSFGNRDSKHNTTTEGKLAKYLTKQGYIETDGNGVWTANTAIPPLKANPKLGFRDAVVAVSDTIVTGKHSPTTSVNDLISKHYEGISVNIGEGIRILPNYVTRYTNGALLQKIIDGEDITQDITEVKELEAESVTKQFVTNNIPLDSKTVIEVLEYVESGLSPNMEYFIRKGVDERNASTNTGNTNDDITVTAKVHDKILTVLKDRILESMKDVIEVENHNGIGEGKVTLNANKSYKDKEGNIVYKATNSIVHVYSNTDLTTETALLVSSSVSLALSKMSPKDKRIKSILEYNKIILKVLKTLPPSTEVSELQTKLTTGTDKDKVVATIVEGTTNPLATGILSESSPYNTSKASLVQRFIKSIQSILGMDESTSTAYTELLRETNNLNNFSKRIWKKITNDTTNTVVTKIPVTTEVEEGDKKGNKDIDEATTPTTTETDSDGIDSDQAIDLDTDIEVSSELAYKIPLQGVGKVVAEFSKGVTFFEEYGSNMIEEGLTSMSNALQSAKDESSSIYAYLKLSQNTGVAAKTYVQHIQEFYTNEPSDTLREDSAKYAAIAIGKGSMRYHKAYNAISARDAGVIDNRLLRDKAVKSPITLLQNTEGKIHANVIHAMHASMMLWVADNGAKTAYKSKKDIGRLLGKDESAVTPQDVNNFKHAGTPAINVALQVGKHVMEMLNIDVDKGSGVDAHFKQRLAQSLGDNALATYQKAYPDIIKNKHYPAEVFDINRAAEVDDDTVLGEQVIMISIPAKLDESGLPLRVGEDNHMVFSKQAESILELLHSNGYKQMRKDLYGGVGTRQTTRFTPIETVPELHAKTSSKVTDALKEEVRQLQSTKHVPNPIYELYKSLSREEFLTLHGWVNPKLIEKMHEGNQDKALGNNLTLEQEYQQVITHDAEITERENTLMFALGAAPIRGKEISAEKREAMQVELDSLTNTRGFYIPYKVLQTGRVMDTSATISKQRSKMHRNMFSVESHVQEIDPSSTTHLTAMMEAFREPLGFKGNGLKEFFNEVISEEGVIRDHVLAKGVYALWSQKNGEVFNAQDIIDAVGQLKGKAHSLNGLNGLQELQLGLMAKEPFKTHLYIEVDGTTNGGIAMQRQIGGGLIPSDYKGEITPKMQKAHDAVVAILNMGGVMLKGQSWKDYKQFKDASNDLYQTVGLGGVTLIGEAISNESTPTQVQTEKFELYKERRELVTTDNADTETINQINKDIDKLNMIVPSQILDDWMPKFTDIKDGVDSLNSNGRNVAKPYVMQGIYLAGDTGLKASGFASTFINKLYSDIEDATTEEKGVIADRFNAMVIEAIKWEATTLFDGEYGTSIDHITKMTVDNSMEKIDPLTYDLLEKMHGKGHGAGMIMSYKDTMGDYTTNVKTVMEAASISSAVAASIINKAVSDAGEHRGMPLNPEEIMALRVKLQAQGVYIGLKHVASKDNTEAIDTSATHTELIGGNMGGKVITDFVKDSILTDTFKLEGSVLVPDVEGERYSSRTSSIKTRVLDHVSGTISAIAPNIGIDALTQAYTLAVNVDMEMDNVFDAQIIGVLDALSFTKNTNKIWDGIHQDYSMSANMNGRMNDMMKLFKTLPKEQRDEISKAVLIDLQPTGSPAVNALSLEEAHIVLNTKLKAIDDNRKLINSSVSSTNQYYLENGESPRTATTSIDDTKGSSNSQIEYKSILNTTKAVATSSNVMATFLSLGRDKQGIQDSKAHSDNLETLLTDLILPMVDKVKKFTLTHQENSNEQGGVIVDDTHIVIKTKPGIRKFGSEMSGQEVLVHEFTHPIWVHGFKVAPHILAEVTRLRAKAKEVVTPNMLLSPYDTSPQALVEAKALWNHIFEGRDSVHEFATIGLTNANVIKALDIQVRSDASIQSKLLSLFNKLLHWITQGKKGQQLKNTTIASALNDMAYEIQSAKENGVTKVARGVYNKVNSTLPLDKGIEISRRAYSKVYTGSIEGLETLQKSDSGKHVARVAKVLATPVHLMTAKGQKALYNYTKDILNNEEKPNFLTKLYSEARGATELTRPLHRMLSKANQSVESSATGVSYAIKAKMIELWESERDLTSTEWQSISDIVMRGDLGSISNIPKKELIAMLEDDDDIDVAIAKNIRLLQSSNRGYLIKQAKSLGNVLANNVPTINNGHLSAYNIVRGEGNIVIADQEIVDSLKTLYMLRQSSVAKRSTLANLLATGIAKDGLAGTIQLQKSIADKKLLEVYDGDVSRVIAGDIRDELSAHNHFTILDKREGASSGLEKVSDLGNGLGVYSGAGTETPYSRGIVTIAGNSMEGRVITIPDARGMDTSTLLPIVEGGKITGYRSVIPTSTKHTVLGVRNHAHTVLGNMAGRGIRLKNSRKYNRKLLDWAVEDLNSATKDDIRKFIRVSTTSSNSQVAEFARVVSSEFIYDANSKFKNGMFIRKEILDLVIGYRKFSGADYLQNKLGAVRNGKAHKSMKLVEDLYQLAVGEVKRRVVLLTPAVVAANFISNIMVSTLYGMNPAEAVKLQAEGFVAIKAYQKNDNEISKLRADISASSNPKHIQILNRRIEVLVGVNESSGIHPLIQAGLFATIVDDVSLDDTSSSMGHKMALRAGLGGTAESFEASVPKVVTKAYSYATLLPNTALGNNIQLATAYSDFVARYAMHKHLTQKKGVSVDDAINDVMDIFVDYAPNTSKGIQYLNDMGLFMYTKFLLRIQRVIMNRLRHNAEGVVALEMAQHMTTDMPDIVDTSLVWGVGLGRSNLPDDIAGSLSTVPILNLLP